LLLVHFLILISIRPHRCEASGSPRTGTAQGKGRTLITKTSVKARTIGLGVGLIAAVSLLGSQAQPAAASPIPSDRIVKAYVCRIPAVHHFIPACSNGRWEPMQIKQARCIRGHSLSLKPYKPFAAIKLIYWIERCVQTDEWQKW
jgi:hypothetical protein